MFIVAPFLCPAWAGAGGTFGAGAACWAGGAAAGGAAPGGAAAGVGSRGRRRTWCGPLGGRGSRRRRRAWRRRARRSVVAVRRLKRDRRRAAKGLEVRDHAEDLLIGQANRRPVDNRHPRIESRHDVGVRVVHRLGEVLDIAQARLALRRATRRPPRGRGTEAPRSGRSCGK